MNNASDYGYSIAGQTGGDPKQLSTRATTALATLNAGGAFRYALETNSFTRREQFQWRLMSKGGSRISGIGGATFRELESAGFSFRRVASGFTGSCAYYYLQADGAPAGFRLTARTFSTKAYPTDGAGA